MSELVLFTTLCDPTGYNPARLLCPWNSSDKNTGVGCHSPFQGIFLSQGLNHGLPQCRQIPYHWSHWPSYGVPRYLVSIWMCLWECFWMGLISESVDWVKQIALSNIVDLHPISWTQVSKKKADPPERGKSCCLTDKLKCWSFPVTGLELKNQAFVLELILLSFLVLRPSSLVYRGLNTDAGGSSQPP